MDESVKYEKGIFNSVDRWMNYIDKLRVPKNDFERVHNQYLCDAFITKIVTKGENFIRNAIAFPICIISVIGTSVYSLIKQDRFSEQCDAVELCMGRKNAASSQNNEYPHELTAQFSDIKQHWQKRKTLYLTGKADKNIYKIWFEFVKRYPFCFYQNLSVYIHLTSINNIISMYKPKIIITMESENDFTTSITTKLCEDKGIEYVGIMHGENFLNPLHAFVRFSRFYVWDEFYINQYVRTGSQKGFFRVYKPERYQNTLERNSNPNYYLTYYLQGQTRNTLMNIKEILTKITMDGRKCKIRMHPRATDKNTVVEIFGNTDIEIEDYTKVSIWESYNNSKYVVSTYSTVLSEAYENGYDAVVDDLTDNETYKTLDKLMYINMSKIKLRLSDIL